MKSEATSRRGSGSKTNNPGDEPGYILLRKELVVINQVFFRKYALLEKGIIKNGKVRLFI